MAYSRGRAHGGCASATLSLLQDVLASGYAHVCMLLGCTATLTSVIHTLSRRIILVRPKTMLTASRVLLAAAAACSTSSASSELCKPAAGIWFLSL